MIIAALEQTIAVTFSYSVHTTEHLLAPDNTLLRDVIRAGSADPPAKVLFAVDRGVTAHHPDLLPEIEEYCLQHASTLRRAAPICLLEGGEAAKNSSRYVAEIHEEINKAGICRHSYVVAIGGGAIIDAVGYAAATAHRGVRLVRVPTTVLAQCDAAVGVKNGINYFDKKNFLGTFTPPFAVINDSTFLATLSARDWRAGVAEAVKVALIKDPAFFHFIEENAGRLLRRDMMIMQEVIHRCAQLHLDHIAHGGDPFEHGSSRPLDFGHWCAHKLEQLTDYQLRHGEAVAIGMALDATYSYVMGFLSEAAWRRILRLLFTLGFALCVAKLAEYLDRPGHERCVLRGLAEFREHLGGRLTVTLLRDIGRGFEVNDMNVPMVIESIAILRRNDANRWKGGWQWTPKPAYVH